MMQTSKPSTELDGGEVSIKNSFGSFFFLIWYHKSQYLVKVNQVTFF